MFNVSLKLSPAIIADFNELSQRYFMEYYDHMYSENNEEWVVRWSNYDSFRIKIANLIHKKSHLSNFQPFRSSININMCTGFMEYYRWVLETQNPVISPFLQAQILDFQQQMYNSISKHSITIASPSKN